MGVVSCRAMGPEPLPPASAECVTTTKLAQEGASPQQAATRIFRSDDGKVRVDTADKSVITDMAKQHTIVLDHLKQEAQVFPMPQTPPPPSMPGAPAPPGMPQAPSMPKMSVQDLGKGFIEGHEVEGKRYIIQPPEMPQMPQAPQMQKPGMPKAPTSPGMPKPPDLPQAPPPPTVSEVWTSTKLKMPVLTKTTGGFGEQVQHCKCSEMPHPDPSLFQIPPGYKVAEPKLPALPKPPAIPKPEIPKPPEAPKPPGMPKLPA
jgi:hypothetical protein